MTSVLQKFRFKQYLGITEHKFQVRGNSDPEFSRLRLETSSLLSLNGLIILESVMVYEKLNTYRREFVIEHIVCHEYDRKVVIYYQISWYGYHSD